MSAVASWLADVGSIVRTRWQELFYGFWFVPGAVVLGCGSLALILLHVDASVPGLRGLFPGDASAARTIFSTVATSVTTVAGITFPVTIVTLQLVATELTPRAMRLFLGRRVNQVTAGLLVGVFVYSLLVLRSITGGASGTGFVPALTVNGGIALAAGTLCMLLVFIHDVASSIQAPNLAAAIAHDTFRAIDATHPEALGTDRGEQDGVPGCPAPCSLPEGGDPVRAVTTGYVQKMDPEGLLEALRRSHRRVCVHIISSAGDFVTPATPVAEIAGVGADISEHVRRALHIGSQRDMGQDPGFGIRQLADIALRALSPAVNDPTTAVTCIGYLGACLERLAGRADHPIIHRGDVELPVVVIRRRRFEDHLAEACNELSRYARENVRVVVQLLDALARVRSISENVGAPERTSAVDALATAIGGHAREAATTRRECDAVESALAPFCHPPRDEPSWR